ncbi:hypothetical protein AB833_23040 [Chromatiales bacterium (ex Bugula neritina AB1)]|nr:hypothetical protein AB833_23040 [Chromatiales bacterium (ex Bugula neritina AB1)]
MPAWKDYKKAAQERGSLALELYVVETTAVKPEQLQQVLPSHLQYQAEQEQRGSLAFAGPLSDETGEQMNGSGLIVYRAESLEAARALADADPMHSSGTRTYTLRRWLVNEGSLQLDVKLSAQSVRL